MDTRTPSDNTPPNKVSPGLYSQTPFRCVAGDAFRPGGLDLTVHLAQACALQPGMRVLDLGCGVGGTASYLAREWGVDVVGVDASPAFIEEARQRDDAVTWLEGVAEQIPCGADSFDVVFCECFLSIVDDPEAVLAEIKRVLHPAGRLALADLYLRHPEERPEEPRPAGGSCMSGARGQADVLKMVQQSGFEVLAWVDRSEALKGFVASLIMTYGSGDELRRAIVGPEGDPAWLLRARPGYYHLVAEARP